MPASFPYEKSFIESLKQSSRNETTIDQYRSTLVDFFNYELHFNNTFEKTQLLDDIVENDIRVYLNMLKENREYRQTTLNKILSNLKVYFGFLFEHRVTSQIPTYSVKSFTLKPNEKSTYWVEQLSGWLINDDLSWYTRAFLVFTRKGYTSAEILAPGFYSELDTIILNDAESAVIEGLQKFIAPLQARYDTKDLFLKQHKHGDDFHLSLAALHKYLKRDSERVGYSLVPGLLRKDFLLWYLKHHRNETAETIMFHLHIDAASLDYYQNLLRKNEVRIIRQRQATSM